MKKDSWKKLGMDLAKNSASDKKSGGIFITSPEKEMELCKRARALIKDELMHQLNNVHRAASRKRKGGSRGN